MRSGISFALKEEEKQNITTTKMVVVGRRKVRWEGRGGASLLLHTLGVWIRYMFRDETLYVTGRLPQTGAMRKWGEGGIRFCLLELEFSRVRLCKEDRATG